MDKVAAATNKAGSAGTKATSVMSRFRAALSAINSRSVSNVGNAAQATARDLDKVTAAANKAGSATTKAGTIAATTWRQAAAAMAAVMAGGNILDTANETMNLDNRLRVIQQDNKKGQN